MHSFNHQLWQIFPVCTAYCDLPILASNEWKECLANSFHALFFAPQPRTSNKSIYLLCLNYALPPMLVNEDGSLARFLNNCLLIVTCLGHRDLATLIQRV